MVTTDRGSSVFFHEGCVQLAELQFTGDFGRVLIVNPNCLTNARSRRWDGMEGVRPEYQRAVEAIEKRWFVERYTIKRR